MGTITEISFDQKGWKTKYHLRFRRYDEAERIADRIYKFLTIKGPAFAKALDRIKIQRDKKEKIASRNTNILELAGQGWSYQEIADKFSISYRSVALICKGKISSGHGGHPKPEIKELRKSRQKHIKQPVFPKTKSRILETPE